MARQRSPPPTLRSGSLFPRLQPPSRTERRSSLRPPNPRAKSEGGQSITTYRNIKIDDFLDIASCPQERKPSLRKAQAGEKKTPTGGSPFILALATTWPFVFPYPPDPDGRFSLAQASQSASPLPVIFALRNPLPLCNCSDASASSLATSQPSLSRRRPISPAALPSHPHPRSLSFPPRRRRLPPSWDPCDRTD